MTDINALRATIEKIKEAPAFSVKPLAEQALTQAMALFRAYDAELAAQRVAMDNMRDEIGRQAVRIEEQATEIEALRRRIEEHETGISALTAEVVRPFEGNHG